MTKPKAPWDFHYRSSAGQPSKGAKILRLVADMMDAAKVNRVNVSLDVVEVKPKPRTKGK